MSFVHLLCFFDVGCFKDTFLCLEFSHQVPDLTFVVLLKLYPHLSDLTAKIRDHNWFRLGLLKSFFLRRFLLELFLLGWRFR